MKFGEKIRSARLNAKMTQADLAGDFITRNMLSQIENGLAMPSLQTALYIADRLGVDIGILFSDNDGKDVFFLTRKLPELKRSFEKKEYDRCIELCSEGSEDNDEACFILSECYIRKAYDMFNNGKLRNALKYGENAVKYASKTVYSSESIKIKNEMLEVMIASITPYLKQTRHKAEEKRFLIDRFEGLAEVNSGGQEVIEARWLTEGGRYAEAIELYKEILRNKNVGVPFEYKIYCDMEVCFRELKDFEGAYKYSQMSKKLFEEMQA